MPAVGGTLAPATLPPAGLDGLDPSFSRVVRVTERGASVDRGWHLLDNADRLAELGVEPVGTILCVHGNPTWSYLWRRLVDAATDAAASGGDAWRVIAVDQLDMGFSERTGTRRPLARRVQDLGDLTNALGLIGPVLTLGHDWGGVVSLGWAVDHPELLTGVLLLNTAVHQPENKPIPAPLRLALQPGILGRGTVLTPAFLETTLSLAHPPLRSAVKDGYRAPYRGAERRGGIGGFVADIPVDADHESWDELERIADGVSKLRVPALMLWGPRDPIFSDRYLDDLIDRMPHADVHRFEGAGHLLAEDVDYASAVLTWLGDRIRTAEELPAAPVEEERAPLWHYLDELQGSDDAAVIDMVPPSGDAPRVVSWKLLSKRVRQLASGLGAAGVKKGDRVSLLIPPSADLVAVLYACLRIGAIVVVADAGLGLGGLTRAVRGACPDHVIGATPGLSAARALGWPGQKISTTTYPAPLRRALGVSHSLAELVALGADERMPEPPAAVDTAAILFTSGSTGPAKGVVYTHGQLSAVRDALAAQYGVGVGTGLVAGFAPFALLGPALGARSVTPDMDVTAPKTLTATAVAAAVKAVDATVVFLSPAAVANVVATSAALTDDDRSALDGVEQFLSAGAPVSEPLLAAISALMPSATAHTPYGMTEGLLMTDITLDGIRDAATQDGAGGVCVGTPSGPTRVRISPLDDNGHATGELTDAASVTGEILVSAPHVEDHYDRLWLTHRASRLGGIPGERWHRTGDVGHLDEVGRLWVEGRMPHVLVTADGVVTPVQPELQAQSVFEVARAAIVGVGPRGLQQVVAVVETTNPARRVSLASPELAEAIRDAVDVPLAAVLVVPRLPTDIRHNSKINRSALSTWADGILSGGRMVAP
ncbi:alpha/beta fold hydrolase [Mycetocola manganoxydans]|uniref:Alpha/beta fold hydrolase n=1 Tax=Mycetocola manganoxydans TaxID=699879 RepID=A0A3L6ZM28_9MICO|nr:alpha/beta fold hydrolase [Mycetocola manganoxydans]